MNDDRPVATELERRDIAKAECGPRESKMAAMHFSGAAILRPSITRLLTYPIAKFLIHLLQRSFPLLFEMSEHWLKLSSDVCL